MREILFRGKALYDGNWVYGSYVHVKDEHIIIPEYAERCGGAEFNCGYLVDPETVGQYTGLKDRNGVRIFEGDIIDHHVQGDILVNRGVIQWDARCARWSHRLNTMNPELAFFNPGAWEVIGNIHDNPEMAEVKKDD